jgi:hypothetical protein
MGKRCWSCDIDRPHYRRGREVDDRDRTANGGANRRRCCSTGKRLFAANSNDDSVSLIDLEATCCQDDRYHAVPNAPLGSTPTALGLLDADHLLVCLGAITPLHSIGYLRHTAGRWRSKD